MALSVVRSDPRHGGKLAQPCSQVAHRQVLDTDPQPQLVFHISGGTFTYDLRAALQLGGTVF